MKEGDLFFDFEKSNDEIYLVGRKFATAMSSNVVSFHENFKTKVHLTEFGVFRNKDFFKVKFPDKTNVRKKYKLQDKVYYINFWNLKYGEISLIMGNYYLVNNDIVFKDIIIPSNWWILHERCKSAIHETSKCLLKLRIYKDLRVLIAKYIWETRNDEECGYLPTNCK